MAKTQLHNYTVQEKLNKMDVDLIDVACEAACGAANDLMIEVTEIPNAVAVEGGSAILQSILIHSEHNTRTPGGIYLISNNSTTFNSAHTIDIDGAIGSTGLNDNIIGGVQATFDVAATTFDQFGNTDEIALVDAGGIPLKAVAGSTSLYVWAMSTGDSDTGIGTGGAQTINLKFGLVKD